MKEIFINNDNLNKNDIDETVIRVKGLIINSKEELLLGYSYNSFQFPGGHLEFGETIKECLKREIKEETGMNVDFKEMIPFISIKYYSENYFNSGKNRCNKLYYFIVRTDKKINLNETNYTEEEIRGKYTLKYVKLNEVIDKLIANSEKYPASKQITYEMVNVISEYIKSTE